MRSYERGPIQKADVLSRGGDTRGHDEKVAVCKSGRGASPETSPLGTPFLDFQPPESGEALCCLSHSACVILFWWPAQRHYSREALGLETSHLVLRMKLYAENRAFRKSPNNEEKDHWIPSPPKLTK